MSSAAVPPSPRIAFGTYGLRGTRAEQEVRAALRLGIRSVDTAQLYKNEESVFRVAREFEASAQPVHVTSKLYANLLHEPAVAAVSASARELGRPIDTMLLHRPLPPVMWRALNACVDQGLVREIGVSNYSIPQLQALLETTTPGCRPPAVNQVEFHPFVGPVQPLLSYCRANSIRVQGHTMLARGEYFDFPPLVRLANKYGVSPAVIMLRWAQQLGVELLFRSSQEKHVDEVIRHVVSVPTPLDPRDMAEISGYHCSTTRRFFPISGPVEVIPELRDITDTDTYVDAMVEVFMRDIAATDAGLAASEAALCLPTKTTRQILNDPIANRIALRLFPQAEGATPQSSYQRYRNLVRKLRNSALEARKSKPKIKGTSCTLPGSHPALQPPVYVGSELVAQTVAHPTAMPVEVSPREELAPFFEFLSDSQHSDAHLQQALPATFTRGTYFPDGRMDLCKQVVGSDHIVELCEAVRVRAQLDATPELRHFLLGNNIACEGESTHGAEALGRLMADPSVEIETWYLAGNSIGPQDMEVLTTSLLGNRSALALWLKRNPLGVEGAAHVGRLLGENDHLRLLDLHNTGLFDEGVERMADALAQTGRPISLRHLYLSGNALTERSVVPLARVLRGDSSQPSSLRSLYLSINRLRNTGLAELVGLIESGALANLRRLDVGAIGLSSPNLDPLVDALLAHCPRLCSLDLGTYKSTRDLGEQANQLSPDVAALVRLMTEHPSIELLNTAKCGLPSESIDRLVAALGPEQSLEGVGTWAVGRPHHERRFLKHPRRVVHIDSIYRGRA